MRKRAIDIDVIRALIITSAFIQHYNQNLYISYLALPPLIVQSYIFTVGGFFFFLAGYMARKVYYKKYIDDPLLTSKSITLKGLKICLLYIIYVIIMRVFTNTPIPSDILLLLFDHQFFTKVLFTFGVLYVGTPIFLYGFKHFKKLLISSILLISILFACYNSDWQIPYSIKLLCFDRELFFYPLFSSIIIYAVGFIICDYEVFQEKEFSSPKAVIISCAFVIMHLVLCKANSTYHSIITNSQYFTFFEAVTPFMAIIISRSICSIDAIYSYISRPYFLCIGIFSLHFYVISNLFIGLLSLSEDSEPIFKLIGLIGIFSLSYTFTFWRFLSIYDVGTLTKRSTELAGVRR